MLHTRNHTGMIGRCLALVGALALGVLSPPGAAQDTAARDVAPVPPVPTVSGDSLVSFVSDSQSPIFVEKFWLRANNNDSAREMIHSRMLADRPNAIFHLGDMVAIGLYDATWVDTFYFFNSVHRADRTGNTRRSNHTPSMYKDSIHEYGDLT